MSVNVRPEPDALLVELAEYALAPHEFGDATLATARLVLADSLGCAALASTHPECERLLGPIVPGTVVPPASRVPGTDYELDPVKAAFDIGALIRWLDFNDTWLAAEWGHPSDNLGAILAVADYLAARRAQASHACATCSTRRRQAHEIQGVLALKNAFNRVGLDHVLLVKVASTAVAGRLLGGDREQLVDALSQRLDRRRSAAHLSPRPEHRLAQVVGGRRRDRRGRSGWRCSPLRGEMGYPSALTAPRWGFQDVLFGGAAASRSARRSAPT